MPTVSRSRASGLSSVVMSSGASDTVCTSSLQKHNKTQASNIHCPRLSHVPGYEEVIVNRRTRVCKMVIPKRTQDRMTAASV